MSTDDVRAPRTREELRSWVLHDLAAHGLTEWRDPYRTSRPVAHYQVLRRRAEYWTYGTDHQVPVAVAARRGVWLAAKTQRLGRRLRLDVPLGTSGPGLLLVSEHADPSCSDRREIRVDWESRIGEACTLYAGVVVDSEPATGRPSRLGDHCLLGEGALVVGSWLGDRVEVADGAVVEDDYGDDVRLSGRPARIVGATVDAAIRRDGRRTKLTMEQSATARRLHADGLAIGVIADAFWASPDSVESAVGLTDGDVPNSGRLHQQLVR